ncbi:MAG: DNA glycosylase AlkZ-like family protein, partial [Gaiellaceae bacterium]
VAPRVRRLRDGVPRAGAAGSARGAGAGRRARQGRYEGPAGTPFLIADGVCAGIWSRKKGASKVELTVKPARKLTKLERAGVEAEAARIGTFLGLEPALSLV